MQFVYNILFAVFFWLSAPYYFTRMRRRGGWQADFGQRFGRYNAELKTALAKRPVIWLHAVSVGEVGVCLQLIRALEARLPAFQFAVSCTTSTGMGELRRNLPPHILRFYYPVDFAGSVRRAMDVIRPRAIILVEAELWPNFLKEAAKRGARLFLVNARISERSWRGYRRFGFFLRPLFAGFAAVGCQTEGDAKRLTEIGFPAAGVKVTGNLKFDAAKPDSRAGLDVPALLAQIGVNKNAQLIAGGSTHPGEEAILADIFVKLRRRFPDLFLVLVPRHFERAKEAGLELETRGLKFIYRSDITAGTRLEPGALECLVVNTTGELKFFYQCATLVFVGKSLAAEGGQNPLEPAALGKPTLFGPNMQNFAAIAKALRNANAVVQVQAAGELEKEMAELLADEGRRRGLGERAFKVVQENQGATEKTVQIIVDGMNGR
jgi:3-deoxy-D-manno-octulosonic-acid transferase